MLLARVLKAYTKTGCLLIVDAHGRRHRIGNAPDGDWNGALTIRLADPSLHWKLALHPELNFGVAYMDGTLTVENGTIWEFLTFAGENIRANGSRMPLFGRIMAGAARWGRKVQQFNPAGRSQRNVAHHYDLSERFYELFLDEDRQYSCAYFARPDMTLEEAQSAKKDHILKKLRLEDGQRVLDIGCGWGGMALHIAKNSDAEVLGITLSKEQLAVARRRADEAGLANRVRFELLDYRLVRDRFDRIVSVGMFEHVGAPHYRAFFRAVEGLLKPDGVALLHSIGRADGPAATNTFIRRYIFPGGYIPALSEVFKALETSDLWATDVEVLRLHYAETLRHWRARFVQNWDQVRDLYDERFCRMWEFYLAGSEMSFRFDRMMVFQMQLTRSRHALPLTRDYMVGPGPDNRPAS